MCYALLRPAADVFVALLCPAAERLRLEIEGMRDGIIGRTAELASLTTGLSQQQAAAAAAVREAAAALSAAEVEVAAAAERLLLLQTQRQEARQALEAAEVAREQGGHRQDLRPLRL
jgi:cobalamin synthase